MLCKNPTSVQGSYFPCGRCEPCRINRKRTWAHRLMLERSQHSQACFVTLTYNDANLPLSANGLSTLAPEDASKFMKRIRKAVEPDKLRFYLVGEYGESSGRPHYHLALFGYGPCSNGQTFRSRGRAMADKCCANCRTLHRRWGLGDIDNGRLEEASAQYMAGYILKKMTRYDDPRLNGRMPEFARMSLIPGIGQSAMHDLADVILRLDLEGDVPTTLARGRKHWPLGRYLRGQLRLMIGREVNAPDDVLEEVAANLLPLRLAARADEENPSLKKHLVEAFAQEVLNRVTRHNLYNRKGSI